MKQTIKNSLRYLDGISSSIGSAIVSKMRDSSLVHRPIDQQQKLLIDCTYIYSTNVNTGIQRVMRNIVHHIGRYAQENGMELVTVALVNGAMIKIDQTKIDSYWKLSKWQNIQQRVERKIELYLASFTKAQRLYEDDILLMLDSSWYLNVWQSVAFAKKRGVKVIGVTYDLIPISHPQFCDDTLGRVFDDWYSRSMIYFDGYISISKTVMSDLKIYLKGQGADIEKYRFDYFELGSDLQEVQAYKVSTREDLKRVYADEKPIYLTVSTIEPRKNHRYLFDTFGTLWRGGSDAIWVVVGRAGWKTESLLQEMRESEEYGDKLWIFDDLDDAELNYCYRHSTALLFPSIVEGYGLPIIESLHNGLPVLASDTPIHREVGRDNITYFDIEQQSALVETLTDIEQGRSTLISVDRSGINIPTWDDSAKDLLEKIVSVVGSRGQ
ncbi:MAG: glycosyltransferase family 1 protein [Campylobacterota bacterium]|nr:glycosyltransferase family 1 protein [Campylobacterota bacterium]